jgi:preprotein translocase subunit YajC
LNNIGLLAVYVVGFIAIFYFLAIRPQQKQRKSHEQLVSSVKRGDKVVSIGGIYGTVKRVEDGLIVMEISKGVEVKLARRAIAEITRAPEKEAPESKKDKAPAEIEAAAESTDASDEVVEAEYVEESAEEAVTDQGTEKKEA